MSRAKLPLDRIWSWLDQSGGDDACWEFQRQRDRYGYGRICVDYKSALAHRVAYELAVGPIPEGLSVLHRCNNRSCCNPAHLYAGTHQENMRDRTEAGNVVKGMERPGDPSNWARGERSHAAKLTASDVIAIRDRYSSGETMQTISDDFGVTKSAVNHIIHRRSWTHV